MNHHTSVEQQIDDATVQRYFNGAGGSTATALSMMAHEHNLPASAARYRLSREITLDCDSSVMDQVYSATIGVRIEGAEAPSCLHFATEEYSCVF